MTTIATVWQPPNGPVGPTTHEPIQYLYGLAPLTRTVTSHHLTLQDQGHYYPSMTTGVHGWTGLSWHAPRMAVAIYQFSRANWLKTVLSAVTACGHFSPPLLTPLTKQIAMLK